MFVLCFLLPRYIIYYGEPVLATSLRSLILSHKSRPSNPTSRTWFSRALSSASLSFSRYSVHPFSFAMPFTPSAEYRSTHRNVVLAFARVPFYLSIWQLIRVFFSLVVRHSILFHSTSCSSAHLFIFLVFSCLFRFLMYVQRVMFCTLSLRGSLNTELRLWSSMDLWKMQMMWKMRVEIERGDSVKKKINSMSTKKKTKIAKIKNVQ